jgi:hypothetical protein
MKQDHVLPHVSPIISSIGLNGRCDYVGLALVWLWYMATSIARMVIISPPPGQGWVESFAGPRYLNTFKLCVTTASFILTSDVHILVLPMIAMSHLRLDMAKKFGVAAIFSTGLMCIDRTLNTKSLG